MSFPSTLIFVFLCSAFWASASVVPHTKIVQLEDPDTFKVQILEGGTKFEEKIKIDEDNGLEYFHVPSHNGLTEADFLYDFKNGLGVMRVKSEAKCYLAPLPASLPKPTMLKTGLQMVDQTPPSKNNVIVQTENFTVGEQVEKRFMRREVQEFCSQFPMFRLQEVDMDQAVELARSRFARDITRANLTGLPFCKNKPLPVRKPGGPPPCHPHKMLFDFHIRENHCTWWLVCQFSVEQKSVMCEDWEHKFSSIICYVPRCP